MEDTKKTNTKGKLLAGKEIAQDKIPLQEMLEQVKKKHFSDYVVRNYLKKVFWPKLYVGRSV